MYKKRKGFTLVELLVVISIIALLVSILMPSLSKARESAKRTVCLSNFRSMQTVWLLYSMDNEDKIVAANDVQDQGWVKNILGFSDPDDNPGNAPEEDQIKSIEDGLLFPYAETIDIYRCPSAKKQYKRNYSISASMNTKQTPFKGKVHIKSSQVPSPSTYMVFIDEEQPSPHAYRLYYYEAEWFDAPPIIHNNGTTLSFVDGHAEYWHWENQDTIDLGDKARDGMSIVDRIPYASQPDNLELRKTQRAIWGKLGY